MWRKILITSTGLSLLLNTVAVLPAGATTHEGSPAASASTPTAVEQPRAARMPVDVICMQKAVEKRDNALIGAVDSYHTAVRVALEARRDTLKAAWETKDRKVRRAELKKVWIRYKEARARATTISRKDKHAAWKQFNVDRKACGQSGAADDSTTAGVDAQL